MPPQAYIVLTGRSACLLGLLSVRTGPMSQTLSWSFQIAADTTGRAVERARRVKMVDWSCIVSLVLGFRWSYVSGLCEGFAFLIDINVRRAKHGVRYGWLLLCSGGNNGREQCLKGTSGIDKTKHITVAEALPLYTPSRFSFSTMLRGMCVHSKY